MTEESFSHLSREERSAVGDPADYDWEHPIANVGRRRSGRSVQFSLRADPVVIDALEKSARARNMTFSEVVRDALRRYLDVPETSTTMAAVYSFGDAKVMFNVNIPASWPQTRAPSPESIVFREVRDPGVPTP